MTTKLQKSLHKMYETSYNTICQTENLSTNPLSHFQLYIENKNKYLYKSNYNNNANFIKMKTIERYLKFSLSINIITKEDKKDIKNKKFQKGIISLYDRGSLNRTTLEVYIDGVKIPDDVCYITVYDGSLDLYIPEKFVSNDVFMDIITKKYSNTDKFSNIIVRNVITHNMDFTLFNTKEINIDTIKIYKNGLLLTRKLDYDVINFGFAVNKFTAIFGTKIKDDDILEIQLDPNCIYYKYDIEKLNSLITVPKDILPNLPISPGICRFYVNGRRIFNRDIEILAPRNFQIKNFIEKSKVLFFINYENLYLDNNLVYHEDGIKAFNSLTDNELEDIFTNNKEPEAGLEWIKDLKYPPRPINVSPNPNLLKDKTFEEFIESTVKEFLVDNPHNIVPLLTEYKENYHFSYNFKVEDLQERNSTKLDLGSIDVYIFKKSKRVAVIPKKYEDYHILSFIDNIKIDEKYVYTRTFNNFIYIYIDDDLMKNAKDLSISILPVYNRNRLLKEFTITEAENQILKIDRSLLGNIRTEKDIIVMKKTELGHSLQKVDIDYFISLDNNLVSIEFNSKNLLEEFVIYNSSFFERNVINIKDEINIYKLNSKSPYYSNYTIEIYNNGKLLVEDLDFFISNQKNITGLEEELIVFRNYPQKNDKLEIYHIEIPKIDFSTCKILKSNNYDLIYFNTDRNFGYGKEYIDLYINDVLVRPNNIREIALNLVAIDQDDIPRPYKYVSARSKFNDKIFDITNYIDHHKENPSKFAEYIDRLIADFNFDKIDEIVSNIYPEISKKPEEYDITLIERELVNPLLDQIATRLRLGLMERRIDANKYTKIFNQIDWLKYMDYKQRTSNEIEINCNDKMIKNGLNISPSDTLIPLDQLNYIVAKEVRDNKFPYLINNIDMSEEEYYTHPISNKLYLEEVKLASCNIDIPKTVIIDANAVEEEYELEDIIRLIDNRKIKKVINLDYLDNQEENQFYFRINTSKLLIEEFDKLYINGLDYTDHSTYNQDSDTLDIFFDITLIDRVEIKYKRKVYSE